MDELEKILGADNGNPSDSLRQMYPKVNRNFDKLKAWFASAMGLINGHVQSNAAHAAEHITYNGEVTGANVKEALDNTSERIDNLIIESGDSSPEVADARGGYPVLGARLNASDAQLADMVQTIDLQRGVVGNSGIVRNKVNVNVPMVSISDFSSFPFRPADPVESWVLNSGTIKANLATGLVGTGAYYKNARLQDGEIGVTIKNYDTVVNCLYGVCFRGKDDQNYLIACINTYDNSASIYTCNSGVITPIYTVGIPENTQISGSGENINLKVRFTGARIQVFYNGTRYIDSMASEYAYYHESNGYFGLFSYCEGGIAQINKAEFSNLSASEYRFDQLNNNLSSMLVIGDSISDFGGVSDISKLWVNLLTNKISESYPDFTANNQAQSGATTSAMYTALTTSISAAYDFVAIMGGVNDAVISSGISLTDSINNMRKMIRLSKSNGVSPIICLTTNIDKTLDNGVVNAESWAYIQELVNRLRVLCTQEKVIIADTNSCLNNNFAGNYAADHIHPNDAGNSLIFDEVFRTIKSDLVTV